MTLMTKRRIAILILLTAGCHNSSNRQPQTPPIVGRGTPALPKPLAIPERPVAPARQPDPLDDRRSFIPPPPNTAGLANPAQVPAAIKAPEEPTNPDLQLTRASAPLNNTAADAATADSALDSMKRLHQSAAAAYDKLEAFDARLTRRESINNKSNPQEVIHFMFRKAPYSVRLKWIGSEGTGREVVFVQGQHGGKMHIVPSRQDSLFTMRMAFLPDDPMVRAKARHDIREAGLNDAIRQIGNTLDMIAKNPAQRNRLRYLGLVTRPEYVTRMEAIEETIVPKAEPLLPQGGKRVIFFDTGADSPSVNLPVLVITHDHAGKEVEYYCFDRVTTKIRFTDADFDPDLVLKKK